MSDSGHGGLVTDEGVVLDFAAADVGSRAFARIIDGVIQAVILTGTILPVALLVDTEPPLVVTVVVSFFVVLFVLPVVVETVWQGRTPGKAALGLRVRTADGGPISLRHAVIRGLLFPVDFLVPPGGATAIVATLVSTRRQRLGDMAAGTVVLRERLVASTGTASERFDPPAGWFEWVARLDVSALTPAQYVLIRNFLLRRDTLDRGARDHLAGRISEAVATELRVPLGQTSRELFLTSVAAAYQRSQASGVTPTPVPTETTTRP